MAKALDVNNVEIPIAKLETEDQCRNWVLELVADMNKWREVCNQCIPEKGEAAVILQKRAMWNFLDKHGQVIGALKTLVMCGKISEVLYVEMTKQALQSLMPTVVGVVQ